MNRTIGPGVAAEQEAQLDVSEQPAVACCLSAREYQTRIAWIQDLTRRALRSDARDDLVLRLYYVPEVYDEVQRMVELERRCCSFLTFDLDQRPDALCVTITAPEAVRDSIDMLFGQFLVQQNSA